jgi:hypothetical protein
VTLSQPGSRLHCVELTSGFAPKTVILTRPSLTALFASVSFVLSAPPTLVSRLTTRLTLVIRR